MEIAERHGTFERREQHCTAAHAALQERRDQLGHPLEGPCRLDRRRLGDDDQLKDGQQQEARYQHVQGLDGRSTDERRDDHDSAFT
jgi:hypothetical protein